MENEKNAEIKRLEKLKERSDNLEKKLQEYEENIRVKDDHIKALKKEMEINRNEKKKGGCCSSGGSKKK